MSKGRVLIVEDDQDIATIMVQILENEGFLVTHVSNGQLALDYLQRADRLPCVVLLDLMMPVMSGWKFLEIAEGLGILSSITVLIMTAHGKLNIPKDLKFFPKPFGMNELTDAVIEVCCGEKK